MDGDYRLEATTHVVGHLLRELDLVLRAVLRPIVSADLWPPRDTPDANRKQINAICDVLGIGADDPFRELWRDYARPLHEWASALGLSDRGAIPPLDPDHGEHHNREAEREIPVMYRGIVKRFENGVHESSGRRAVARCNANRNRVAVVLTSLRH